MMKLMKKNIRAKKGDGQKDNFQLTIEGTPNVLKFLENAEKLGYSITGYHTDASRLVPSVTHLDHFAPVLEISRAPDFVSARYESAKKAAAAARRRLLSQEDEEPEVGRREASRACNTVMGTLAQLSELFVESLQLDVLGLNLGRIPDVLELKLHHCSAGISLDVAAKRPTSADKKDSATETPSDSDSAFDRWLDEVKREKKRKEIVPLGMITALVREYAVRGYHLYKLNCWAFTNDIKYLVTGNKRPTEVVNLPGWLAPNEDGICKDAHFGEDDWWIQFAERENSD